MPLIWLNDYSAIHCDVPGIVSPPDKHTMNLKRTCLIGEGLSSSIATWALDTMKEGDNNNIEFMDEVESVQLITGV